MKELYGEGVATHTDPESCAGSHQGAGEALTGAHAGRAIEPRKQQLLGADAVTVGGRQHEPTRDCERGSAWRGLARRVLQIDDLDREKDTDGTVYFLGAVRSELSDRDYTIALGCIGGAGNPGAAAAAASAIATFRPHVVLLMGIAGLVGPSNPPE